MHAEPLLRRAAEAGLQRRGQPLRVQLGLAAVQALVQEQQGRRVWPNSEVAPRLAAGQRAQAQLQADAQAAVRQGAQEGACPPRTPAALLLADPLQLEGVASSRLERQLAEHLGAEAVLRLVVACLACPEEGPPAP
mmetsp:Transcript_8226/g.30343  ORF Transcript_8226/g.30343 Transcript_8226/m.30343 type:complete len:136 (-) Transcript_8226:396-803(-)